MLSVRDPFTCVHARAHTALCWSVYIGQGLFRILKKKSNFYVFLTLLLFHSVFLSFYFLSALSPSYSVSYLLPSPTLHPSSHSLSLQLPSPICSRSIHKITFSVFTLPLFSVSLFCFLCHHYPVF